MRTPLLALALLLGLPALAEPPPAPPPTPASETRTLLVWGGGQSRAEAEKVAADYEVRAKLWKGLLRLADGYPRILESASVPGLNPGFYVVVLGVCEAKAGAELAGTFDLFEPRTYPREVTWAEPGALPCPTLAENWRPDETARARGKAGELLAASFSSSETSGEVEYRNWFIALTAVDKKGELIDSSAVTNSDNHFAELQSLTAKGAEVELVEQVVKPACHGAPEYRVRRRVWRYGLKNGAIVARKVSDKVTESGPCEYGDY